MRTNSIIINIVIDYRLCVFITNDSIVKKKKDFGINCCLGIADTTVTECKCDDMLGNLRKQW